MVLLQSICGATLTKGAGSSDLTLESLSVGSNGANSLTTIIGAGSGSFVISAIATTSSSSLTVRICR